MTFTSVIKRMFVEEWRMHSTMFGGKRFAAFPFLIIFLIANMSFALWALNVSFEQLAVPLHLLVVFFGLHTGSIAFISNDAIENVLGDTTFIIFSSRTLPISQRTLYVAFILKDIVYYTALFIIPITLGLLPFAIMGTTSLTSILVLTVSLLSVFVLGLVTVVTLVSLWNHGIIGKLLTSLILGGVVVLLAVGYPVLSWTPFNTVSFTTNNITFVTDPNSILQGFTSVAIGIIASIVLNPVHVTSTDSKTRARGNTYAWVRDRLPVDDPGLTAKTLVDLHRSSGSIMKPVFSMLIMFLVAVFLDVFFTRKLGLRSDPVLWYPVLLSFSAFTTYNWLTQSDSVEEYMSLPVSPDMLLEAKTKAFALVSILVIPFYVAGVIIGDYIYIAHTVTPLAYVTGFVVLVGFTVYFFKVTVVFTGFDPSALLFDTTKFFGFAVATLITIPVLLLAFTHQTINPTLLYGFVVVGVTVLASGVWFVPGAEYRKHTY